jgi:hypothetical protein
VQIMESELNGTDRFMLCTWEAKVVIKTQMIF